MVRLPIESWGPRGMRPTVPFMPTSPVKPAGIRIEPPPSPPVAMVTRPPATAAALPPDDPPAVRVGSHGLPVVPLSLVTDTLSPPNSLAVVWPIRLAPPRRRSRSTMVLSWVAVRSLKTREAAVSGQPATESSSLTPMGTPPNGSEVSAPRADSSARSASMWEKALSVLASIAASDASTSSTGDRSPDRNASTREQVSPSHGLSTMRQCRTMTRWRADFVRAVAAAPRVVNAGRPPPTPGWLRRR